MMMMMIMTSDIAGVDDDNDPAKMKQKDKKLRIATLIL